LQTRRRFRFIREIAEGGFGKVYLAEMQSGDNFSSVVAIKVLHGKWAQHEEIAQRSRDEARLLGRLRHRNIVRVEDLTSIHGQCAVIMEYLEGVDLKTLVNTVVQRGERLPLRCCFEVVGAVAEALRAAYTHAPLQGGEPLKLIHRDIKPSNILLTVGGDVKLLDFGTARANFEEREARTQALAFGSQAYMAPERMMGDPDGPECDIFSLGITGYEIISGGAFGKIPIRPDKFHKAVDQRIAELEMRDLPEDLADRARRMLRAMLAYEPEDRPAAAQVVDVMEILSDEARDQGLRRFARQHIAEIAAANPHAAVGPTLSGQTVYEDRSPVAEDGSLGQDDGTVFAAEDAPQDPLSPIADVPLELREGMTMVPDEDVDDELSSPVELSPLRPLPPHLQAVANVKTEVLRPDSEAPTVLEDEDDLRARLGYEPAEAETMVAPPRMQPTPPGPPPPLPRAPSGPTPVDVQMSEPLPKKKGRSKLLLVGVMLGVFLLTVGLGGAGIAAWYFLIHTSDSPVDPIGELIGDPVEDPIDDPDADTVDVEDPVVEDPVVEDPVEKPAFEVIGPAGGVRLTVVPFAQRDITLTKTGAGKLKVSGSGPIEVEALHEGTWRTKISGGDSHRGDFKIVPGKVCSYSLDLADAGAAWALTGCE
jgi:serine/threonine protein kinase